MGEIIRFPFESALDEYTKTYHNNDEYTRLFYVMDDDITNKINNIYNLAFLEIGLLSETLDYLRPDFLKQNFSQFKIFIPENLVNYYQMMLVD